MPADISSVHINRALASLSVELMTKSEQYLVPRICARRRVKNVSDSFFRYGRESAKVSPSGSNQRFLRSVTAPGSPAPIVERTVDDGTYFCHRYSLRELVTDAEIQRSDAPLEPLQDAARVLHARIMNDMEAVAGRIICDADNYPAAGKTTLTTGANGTSWARASYAGTGSDPLEDIATARAYVEAAIQREANMLAMSRPTLYALSDHTDLSGILQYTDSTFLERGFALPPVFRGLLVASGSAVYDSAAEGAAFSGEYLFHDEGEGTNEDVAIVCYKPPGGEIGVRGFSSFIWFDCADETTRQHGVSLRSYRDDSRRGWFVEAAATFDIQGGIVDSNNDFTGAYLIARTTV